MISFSFLQCSDKLTSDLLVANLRLCLIVTLHLFIFENGELGGLVTVGLEPQRARTGRWFRA